MKPIIFILWVLFSFSVISCGNANNEVNNSDTIQVNTDTMMSDTPAAERPADTATPEKKPAEKPVNQLIKVDNPQSDAIISSPLTIKGEAVGYWFFEADFPVRLYDANDSLLSTAIAMAQGEWMTEQFVPFSTTMKFNKPATPTGKLVFEKSNPSGLKEHERSFSIPVRF